MSLLVKKCHNEQKDVLFGQKSKPNMLISPKMLLYFCQVVKKHYLCTNINTLWQKTTF